MTIAELMPQLEEGLVIKTATHRLRKGRVSYEWTNIGLPDIWWPFLCPLSMVDITTDWEVEETI